MRASALLLLVAACSCARQAPVAFSTCVAPLPEGARLVVVGDLQRTAPFLEPGAERNDPEREVLVQAIADVHPRLLAITGDCVFNGASDSQWSAFDSLVGPLHREHIAAVSAFGNHEYWGGRAAAEEHVFPRFPLDGNHHWFSIGFGPLTLVVLDANVLLLSSARWSEQIKWYESTLLALDNDPSVRGVLVLLHHAPYTNSTVFDAGDDGWVQRDFVPPLMQARKTLGMLTGHVHSYERFAYGGKTFVVSGGGGGPRARLATGRVRRHPDDLFDGPAIRDFNFTVYTPTSQGIDATVVGLKKGATETRVMDHFFMAWPP